MTDNQPNFILIDGSYFIFYRYFAILNWFKLAKKDQIIDKDNVLEFRKKVNEKLLSFIKENLPSLAESDKSLPPNDWIN